MSYEIIRRIAIAKIGWIKKQQRRLVGRILQLEPGCRDGEICSLWGRSYVLEVKASKGAARVELSGDHLLLMVRRGTSLKKKRAVLDDWYREQIKDALPGLLAKWEPVMGVKVDRFSVRKMKTRWGSCSPRRRSLRFSTELAKRSPEFLEYVVIHEMAHLLEASHNRRFKDLMDRFLPEWRAMRTRLNTPGLSAWGQAR